MGRVRKYADAAEKQRAYRERKKVPPLSPSELATLLDLLRVHRTMCIFPPDELTDMIERLELLTKN